MSWTANKHLKLTHPLHLKLHPPFSSKTNRIHIRTTPQEQCAPRFISRHPAAKHLLADRRYDADWFRDGLRDKGNTPCIPPKKNRNRQISYDKALYKQRYKVENMFGRLKD